MGLLETLATIVGALGLLIVGLFFFAILLFMLLGITILIRDWWRETWSG